jgi:DNA-binding NarL/FixJ family response regulator
MQAPSLRVLIVGESALVSMGLRQVLDSAATDFAALCAMTGLLSAELVDQHDAQVAILHMQRPTDTHVHMVRALKAARPDVGVVVVTASHEAAALGALVLAGVDAVLDVTVTPEALVEVLRLRQRRLGFVTSCELWPVVVQSLLGYGAADDGRAAHLTPREREVYDLLRDGRTDREIALQLTLSLWTVKHHVGNILQKLDLRSRRELLHI